MPIIQTNEEFHAWSLSDVGTVAFAHIKVVEKYLDYFMMEFKDSSFFRFMQYGDIDATQLIVGRCYVVLVRKGPYNERRILKVLFCTTTKEKMDDDDDH